MRRFELPLTVWAVLALLSLAGYVAAVLLLSGPVVWVAGVLMIGMATLSQFACLTLWRVRMPEDARRAKERMDPR